MASLMFAILGGPPKNSKQKELTALIKTGNLPTYKSVVDSTRGNLIDWLFVFSFLGWHF